ncbi:hypothetical protein QFC22_006265 [Naganishia vaughanmartiniae]|uniref:Uncharacterized protein n=1 Tax=Naganishia vaughanmartiniae TaxID=1424756 RepID=A0ACC2WN50_9TREE|nr:hypothetical protein QFC22_006265 [Naganishia vaughanmartiniae]
MEDKRSFSSWFSKFKKGSTKEPSSTALEKDSTPDGQTVRVRALRTTRSDASLSEPDFLQATWSAVAHVTAVSGEEQEPKGTDWYEKFLFDMLAHANSKHIGDGIVMQWNTEAMTFKTAGDYLQGIQLWHARYASIISWRWGVVNGRPHCELLITSPHHAGLEDAIVVFSQEAGSEWKVSETGKWASKFLGEFTKEDMERGENRQIPGWLESKHYDKVIEQFENQMQSFPTTQK